MKRAIQVVSVILFVSLLAQVAIGQGAAAPAGERGARRGGARGAGMAGFDFSAFAGFGGGPVDPNQWWNIRNIGTFRYQDSKKLPLISVKGNKFVDPEGKTVLFKGISISDPDKIEYQGHWNKAHFEQVKAMGAKLVRIPVHPIAWRQHTPEKYVELLDQAVQWCTELDMYVIIDWHSIGNLVTELFQDPMYETTRKETFEFWRIISRRYAGNNTVAFYELFNEPTIYREQLGRAPWSQWKEMIEEMIHIIRGYDKETIPLVAGFDWAYDLTPLRREPINEPNIGYVTHCYINKRNDPHWESKWEEDFGFAADTYPVVATEFSIGGGGGMMSFGRRGGTAQQQDPKEGYDYRIIKYLEGKGISWLTWVFDPEWGPAMLRNWDYELSEGGEATKKALAGELQKTE